MDFETNKPDTLVSSPEELDDLAFFLAGTSLHRAFELGYQVEIRRAITEKDGIIVSIDYYYTLVAS